MPAIGIGIGVVFGGGAVTPPPVSDGELDATVSGTVGATFGTFEVSVETPSAETNYLLDDGGADILTDGAGDRLVNG
jgi:hypothetical protein